MDPALLAGSEMFAVHDVELNMRRSRR